MSNNYYNSNPYNHPDYEKDNNKDNKTCLLYTSDAADE